MPVTPVSSVTQSYRNVTSPNANTRVNHKPGETPVAAKNDDDQNSQAEPSQEKQKSSATKEPPSQTEENELRKLKSRDTEVRAHEQAHLSAAGKYATSHATFTYQRGPDGKNYAVGGEISIDTNPVLNNPQATLEKALAIQKAALAPVQPSAQDRSVAAKAMQMATEARIQILAETNAETETTLESSEPGNENKNDTSTGINEYESIATYNENLPKSILFGVA